MDCGYLRTPSCSQRALVHWYTLTFDCFVEHKPDESRVGDRHESLRERGMSQHSPRWFTGRGIVCASRMAGA